MNKRLVLNLHGRVQGVGFRVSASNFAESLGIKGYIKNESDRSLTIIIEGAEDKLKDFYDWAKNGTKLAWIKSIRLKWEEPTNEFNKFEIRY